MVVNLGVLFICLFILGPQSSGLIMDAGTADLVYLQGEIETLKSQFTAIVHNINSECNIQCPSRQSVAFMAQLSSNLNNPVPGRVVVFDDVITNVGNAYNRIHGMFTAPVNGTYNFNLVVSGPPTSQTEHWLHLYIVKNSTRVGYVFLDAPVAYWIRRTTDITLHLTEKEEVWVEVAEVGGDHILGGCCLHTHFSGFLIEVDRT